MGLWKVRSGERPSDVPMSYLGEFHELLYNMCGANIIASRALRVVRAGAEDVGASQRGDEQGKKRSLYARVRAS